ncbi:MAG: DMT family transporter [Proteobacteria bacterium]|nr:MAG: DMT family transporter [Pseudomonadota bacterium]QKK11005.1 MAG: DMT family transporter [Pseudomonadota bacterium]
MNRDRKAYLFAGLAIAAWSTVASAFKLSLRELSPAELLLYASLTSTLVLAVVIAWQHGWRSLREWRGADYLASFGLGLLNPFLYYLVLFGAYDRLPAQEAQPLNYAWPIVLVLLAAVFLGQRLKPAILLAMGVSLAGVAVISTRGELLAMRFTDPAGVSLALASTVIWASYWLLTLRDRRDPVVRLWVSFLFGSIAILIYVLCVEPLRMPGVRGLMGAAYVGCFEMGLTFVWWLSALRYARNAAQVSGLIFLSPFISLFFIHFTVGEPIYSSTVIGLVLIVGGIIAQRHFQANTLKTDVQ